MALTWAILRPDDEARALVEALRAHGVDAHAIPAIERAALPWRAVGEPVDIVLLTSAYAAELVSARRDLAVVVVGATAPATANAARAHGMNVAFTCTGGAAELAAACVAYLDATTSAFGGRRARVLYPTSDAGEGQAEQQRLVELVGAHADLVRVAAYTTRTRAGFADDLARVRDGARAHPRALGLVLASPSAVRAYAEVARDVTAGKVVCLGASTVRAWDEAALRPAPILAARDRPLLDVIVEEDS